MGVCNIVYQGLNIPNNIRGSCNRVPFPSPLLLFVSYCVVALPDVQHDRAIRRGFLLRLPGG